MVHVGAQSGDAGLQTTRTCYARSKASAGTVRKSNPRTCSFLVATSTQVRVISLAKGPGEGGPRPPGVQRPFNRCWLHERRKPSIWTSSKAAEREGQEPRRILRKLPALPASRDEKWTGWPRRRNRLRLPEPRCGGDCQHPCPSTSRRSGLLGMPGALAGEEGWRPTNYHFGFSMSRPPSQGLTPQPWP